MQSTAHEVRKRKPEIKEGSSAPASDTDDDEGNRLEERQVTSTPKLCQW